MNPLVQYWYFHLPNFILAALMYTLMGRLVLSFLVAPDWNNYIWRAFVRLTDPATTVVRALTPAVLPHLVVLVFAVLWLMLLRVALFLVLGKLGLLPTVSGS
jgi:uncharacterized protein YggT (Ycf19 family)